MGFVVMYFIVWLFFIIDGPIPTGNGLTKADWLSYAVSLIGGAITLILGVVVFRQNLRMEEYSKGANKLSEQALKIQQNNFRPYLRINKDTFQYAVSKATYGFSKDYLKSMEQDFEFTALTKNDETKLNSCYPDTVLLSFDIGNAGNVDISEVNITRLEIFDEITGTTKGFSRNIDTSMLSKENKKLRILVSKQVVLDSITAENEAESNKITNHYREAVTKNIRMIFIEFGMSYKDIYGEEYEQEFSFHLSYSLAKETCNELILNIDDLEIQAHTEKSPYGPRND